MGKSKGELDDSTSEQLALGRDGPQPDMLRGD
jgi:hypothetical protein